MIEERNVLDRELHTFASEAFEPMLRAHGVRPADVVRFKVLNRLHGVVAAASDNARRARAMARGWRRRSASRTP
jgi:hypothetical protein